MSFLVTENVKYSSDNYVTNKVDEIMQILKAATSGILHRRTRLHLARSQKTGNLTLVAVRA
jgi:hypothetical protein